jgi:uncharacterized membrane protein
LTLEAVRKRINLRLIGIAIVSAAIMHIVATMAAPHLQTANAYARATVRMSANQFVVLPPVSPQTQMLPFQLPDFRYAVCRYVARSGPMLVRAVMPEPGWLLTVTSSNGDNIYALQSSAGGRREVSLRLVPPGERFVDLMGDAQSTAAIQVPLPTASGLIVVRAPVGGIAFRQRIEAALGASSCALQAP